MADVRLPSGLTTLFPGTPRRLDLPGGTVREVVAALNAQVPGVQERLLGPGPRIREHIKVFVDGELADLDTPVPPGGTVQVILAVSGG